ncbi:molecular chaperone [Serratia sp. NPDC078593]|uniref:fimbrial biogenesis chaperone n=1 Tax=unclassified Serratia (in: enterobacteria) TaxID=2647522 RepID=UPI0037D8D8B6
MKKLMMLWLLGASLASSGAVANQKEEPQGISFYVLRVIFPEKEKKGVTLTANNKTQNVYLMQSWIQPVDVKTGGVLPHDGQTPMPFIVTPPLQRLDPGDALTLRIRRTQVALPEDRESVFFISLKAIPLQQGQEQSTVSQQLTLTVVSNLKLFYRPKSLEPRAVAEVAHQLRFRREGQRLIAENPTPYWLTFSRLKIGNDLLDKARLRVMVPPKGQQAYVLPDQAAGEVSWQLIDEDGWDTPWQRQAL